MARKSGAQDSPKHRHNYLNYSHLIYFAYDY